MKISIHFSSGTKRTKQTLKTPLLLSDPFCLLYMEYSGSTYVEISSILKIPQVKQADRHTDHIRGYGYSQHTRVIEILVYFCRQISYPTDMHLKSTWEWVE